ncbi:hypothetical protein AQJ23_45145 [Streptomyces antibioticus]|nr:hypothetical protein [Streptomyces antibioticus]KUN16466.1 hypothetical protein AQJ23_45145 [Streptomyces antibioticus]
MSLYPAEKLGEYEDDGTMPENVGALADAVVGHRIVKVERGESTTDAWGDRAPADLTITLDNGKRVSLVGGSDCCAYTELESFLLHADRIDHIITGVGTTDGYNTWHIYADMGDVLELSVGWSSGNPFYYAYGFHIAVEEIEDAAEKTLA